MAAIDVGVVGQLHQLLERIPHHRGRALDDATAADREQGVADEGNALGRYPEGDVVEGVPGRLEDAHFVGAEEEGIALAHRLVAPRNLAPGGADDPAAELLLEGEVGFNMVAVMMGREDAVESPVLRLEVLADRSELGRVDGRGDARIRVVDEDAEIVASAHELLDHQAHCLHLPVYRPRLCLASAVAKNHPPRLG